MKLPGFLLAACCLPLLAIGEDAPAPKAPPDWGAVKQAWAKAHLDLAGQLLKKGFPGFADAQAGLAGQLLGSEHPDVGGFWERRAKAPLPQKPWNAEDWKAYRKKREALHRKHAQEAAQLLAQEPDEAEEIEAWALKLDPDQKAVRKRRGEERVDPFGWVPQDAAGPLRRGQVLVDGAWAQPGTAPRAWPKTYDIPTEHFHLTTTLPHAQALGVARDIEALRQVWADLLEGVADLPPGKRPRVCALTTLADYQACVAELCPAGIPRSQNPALAGFADAAAGIGFFKQEMGPGAVSSPRGIMLHEVTHLIHGTLLQGQQSLKTGAWCWEGTATWMEVLGKDRPVSREELQAAQRHPSGGLLKNPVRNELLDAPQDGFSTPQNYQEGFSLAYALLHAHGGAYQRPLLQYLLEVAPGDAEPGDLARCFPGLDRQQFLGVANGCLKSVR